MLSATILDLCARFDQAGVRCLIVGGYAVIAHGYLRATRDLDLVLDPAPGARRSAMAILADLGFRPRAPVALTDFADPAIRARWMAEKDMVVFTVWRHTAATGSDEIDLFLEPPFPFDDAWADAHTETVGGTALHFISLHRLVAMKRSAGRAKDLEDIRQLTLIHGQP